MDRKNLHYLLAHAVGTVYLTILVTVNRYIAVCRPYDATDTRTVKRQAQRHVILICAFSVVFNTTRFLEYDFPDVRESLEANANETTTAAAAAAEDFILKPTKLKEHHIYQVLNY